MIQYVDVAKGPLLYTVSIPDWDDLGTASAESLRVSSRSFSFALLKLCLMIPCVYNMHVYSVVT